MAQKNITILDNIKLNWNEDVGWEGSIDLPVWAGYLTCDDPSSGKIDKTPSKGKTRLVIHIPSKSPAPSKELLNSLASSIANQADFQQQALQLIARHARISHVTERSIPNISDIAQLKKYIGLYTLHVSQYQDTPGIHVGLELGCKWQKYIGLGVYFKDGKAISVAHCSNAIHGVYNTDPENTLPEEEVINQLKLGLLQDKFASDNAFFTLTLDKPLDTPALKPALLVYAQNLSQDRKELSRLLALEAIVFAEAFKQHGYSATITKPMPYDAAFLNQVLDVKITDWTTAALLLGLGRAECAGSMNLKSFYIKSPSDEFCNYQLVECLKSWYPAPKTAV